MSEAVEVGIDKIVEMGIGEAQESEQGLGKVR